MKLNFAIDQHEIAAGTVFDDAVCYGVYIEIGDNETEAWLIEKGFDGNGYTILGLVDSLCRLDLQGDAGKYEMEAEADNTWVYGKEKEPITRLVEKFNECMSTEAGVQRLIENADDEMIY